MNERTIRIEALTRVEGEGALHVRLRDGEVEELRLEIYEPPRLFEALLRGRALEDVPDITARICGICPVAYQMSSVHALEAALGITVTPEIRGLRRLLYCGEWIESHALHVYLLHAPDFLGFDSGLDMAHRYPDDVQRGLRMKKIGNRLLEILGGRAIHPINPTVGGFYRCPPAHEIRALREDFQWGLDAAIATARWVAGFDFPDFEARCPLVALHHDDEYAMNEGIVAVSTGERIPVEAYEAHFQEHQVPHSTALHSLRSSDGSAYLVGPLARVALNFDQLCPTARQVAADLGVKWPSFNPFHAIVARGLELIHAFEEGLRRIENYEPARPSRVPYDDRAGEGCAATEAPRGLLYHRYQTDDRGQIRFAKIVPPTSQNQAQIELHLRQWISRIVQSHEDGLARQCENLVRCYDPCISCSTHFLRVHVENVG